MTKIKDEMTNVRVPKRIVDMINDMRAYNPIGLSQGQMITKLVLEALGYNSKSSLPIQSSTRKETATMDKAASKKYKAHLAEVKKNGFALKNVPKKLITKELCLAAATSGYIELDDIPDELITKELCSVVIVTYLKMAKAKLPTLGHSSFVLKKRKRRGLRESA